MRPSVHSPSHAKPAASRQAPMAPVVMTSSWRFRSVTFRRVSRVSRVDVCSAVPSAGEIERRHTSQTHAADQYVGATCRSGKNVMRRLKIKGQPTSMCTRQTAACICSLELERVQPHHSLPDVDGNPMAPLARRTYRTICVAAVFPC